MGFSGRLTCNDPAAPALRHSLLHVEILSQFRFSDQRRQDLIAKDSGAVEIAFLERPLEIEHSQRTQAFGLSDRYAASADHLSFRPEYEICRVNPRQHVLAP